jgi:hypothetical protein
MPIEADMMLANAAVMQNGALTIVGAGWVVRAPGAEAGGASAIALVIKVPRDQPQGQQHQLRLELLDSDDEIVVVDPPNGPGPMIIESEFAPLQGVDDPNITIPLTASIGLNLPPFPLPRGQQYRWRVFVDGETRDAWTLPFRTSPPAAPRPKVPR